MTFDINNATITYLGSPPLDTQNPPFKGEHVDLRKNNGRHHFKVLVTSIENKDSYKGVIQWVESDGEPALIADGFKEGSEVSFLLSNVFSIERHK